MNLTSIVRGSLSFLPMTACNILESSNKPPGPFEKLLNKFLINLNTLPKYLMYVVTQQASDVPRMILRSKEEKQSKAAPPNSSAELHLWSPEMAPSLCWNVSQNSPGCSLNDAGPEQ